MNMAGTLQGSSAAAEGGVDIKFSHIQLYTDRVCAVSEYKELEAALNTFNASFGSLGDYDAVDILKGQQLWSSLRGTTAGATTTAEDDKAAVAFVPHGRDVIKQLIAAFGFRVTGCYPDVNNDLASSSTVNTNSVLVTSSDPDGIQILVMSAAKDNTVEGSEAFGGVEILSF